MLGQAELRGDDYHPLAVVEIDDAVAPEAPGTSAARLEQRSRQADAYANATACDAHDERIKLPDDLAREPVGEARCQEAHVRAVQRATRRLRIDVPELTLNRQVNKLGDQGDLVRPD